MDAPRYFKLLNNLSSTNIIIYAAVMAIVKAIQRKKNGQTSPYTRIDLCIEYAVEGSASVYHFKLVSGLLSEMMIVHHPTPVELAAELHKHKKRK